MADFLGFLASVAIIAFTWKAALRLRSMQHHGRFVRHALGFVFGFFLGLVALLVVIAGMHWMAFAAALGLGWFALHRKPPASERPAQMEAEIYEEFEINEQIRREPRSIEEWRADLTTIWAGDTATISFTYQNNDGDKSRRKVDVDEIQRDRNGEIYLLGLCHSRNERRTFRVSRIDSDIRTKGRIIDPFEWVEETTGQPA